jgi:hypothetical protein
MEDWWTCQNCQRRFGRAVYRKRAHIDTCSCRRGANQTPLFAEADELRACCIQAEPSFLYSTFDDSYLSLYRNIALPGIHDQSSFVFPPEPRSQAIRTTNQSMGT